MVELCRYRMREKKSRYMLFREVYEESIIIVIVMMQTRLDH